MSGRVAYIDCFSGVAEVDPSLRLSRPCTMSGRVAYIDCFSGVAGDMLLAAAIDAGADIDEVVFQLKSIVSIAHEWELTSTRVMKSLGMISALHVDVHSIHRHQPLAPPTSDKQDITHSHEHSHGHQQSHSHGHDHGHDQDDKGHEHGHGNVTRNLTDIIALVLQSDVLSRRVKYTAIQAFAELAIAEATVHGAGLQQVHFHEVGAIDSIVDTLGCVIALELLGVEQVFCSPMPLGSGTVWAAHGLMPVPAPATLLLLRGMVLCPGPAVKGQGPTGELVTPTGASLIRALCGFVSVELPQPELWDNCDKMIAHVLGQARGRMEQKLADPPTTTQGAPPPAGFQLLSVGLGAGTKDFPMHPNILRLLVGCYPAPTAFPVPLPPIPAILAPVVPVAADIPAASGTASELDHNHGHSHNHRHDHGHEHGHEHERGHGHAAHSHSPAPSSTTGTGVAGTAEAGAVVVAGAGAAVGTAGAVGAVGAAGTGTAGAGVDPIGLWAEESMLLLQANLDDITAEMAGCLMEELLAAGANDAWLGAITMKKSRQAMELNVLCGRGDKGRLLRFLFSQSTTIGVRVLPVQRCALRRETRQVLVSYGTISVKVSYMGQRVVTVKPEFDECRRRAGECGAAVKDVLGEAQAAAQRLKMEINSGNSGGGDGGGGDSGAEES